MSTDDKSEHGIEREGIKALETYPMNNRITSGILLESASAEIQVLVKPWSS